jgi:hypothetical protein
VKVRLLWLLLAAGCAPALRGTVPPPDGVGSADAAALSDEVHALTRRIDGERSAERRAELAGQAVAAGQRCEAVAPGSARCDYALAVALGVQARERPSTFREGLAQMAANLRRAAATEPTLDQGGPNRVLSLLLVRAPGWPVGPGDAEEGLAEARRAVALFPNYAPNALALAEALSACGQAEAARAAAEHAAALARAAANAGQADAADWLKQAHKLGAP